MTAPVHGINGRFYLNGYDLSGVLNKASADHTIDTSDTSVFTSTAHTHIPGLGAAKVTASGLLDLTTLDTGVTDHTVLSGAIGVAGSMAWLLPSGAVLGSPCGTVQGTLDEYKPDIPFGSVVTLDIDLLSKMDVDWGYILHAFAAETTSGQSASVDNAAASTNGGAINLMVGAVTGTTPSLTAKVQHSTDNSTWVDLATFTAVTTSRQYQRVVIPAGTTVNRYTRAFWTISGTTPSIPFHVDVARQPL